jgi:peptidoglycan hydrolase CwlO-like protein
MAYDDYDNESATTGEILDSVRTSISDLDDSVKKVTKSVDSATAGLRQEIAQSRRDIAEMRATMARLQARFDNQLVALILANIASGIGVAALMLGATQAF